jgi:hypothetical protein
MDPTQLPMNYCALPELDAFFAIVFDPKVKHNRADSDCRPGSLVGWALDRELWVHSICTALLADVVSDRRINDVPPSKLK